nr:LLM class F420-dependent oxidoreductase [Nakamurella antarctica]
MTEPQQGASYADLLAVALATKEAGFSAFFRSDHVLAMGDGDGLPGPSDAWITLAGLARDVSDIRLGTLVSSATFRHPSMLAIAVANVDEMSAGRVELGLGSGWFEEEHRAYGLPFGDSFGQRFDVLTEQLEVITGLWAAADGKTYSHHGVHYQLENAPGLPKPVQRNSSGRPAVPLVLGGHGPKRTPALAARFASDFNVAFSDLETTTAQFDRVRAACEAIGRDPESITYSAAQVLCLGATDADVSRRAAAIGRDGNKIRIEGAGGSYAQVVDKLGRWEQAGVGRVYLQILDLADLDHVAEAGQQLITN